MLTEEVPSMKAKRPVVAIALDSADPQAMQAWMSQGYLKNFQKLIQSGVYGSVKNTVQYGGEAVETASTERLWTTTWAGCRPDKTGCWDSYKYLPDSYSMIWDDPEKIGCDYTEFPPFYALGNEYKVAAFDLSSSGLSDRVNGLQVLGWGGHYPFTVSQSLPANLLPDLIQQYGKNEILNNDAGEWFDGRFIEWMDRACQQSVATRSKIYLDLLKRDTWDLFVVGFPEIHSAGHELIHLSDKNHPLYSTYKAKFAPDFDPLLNTYEAVDRAIGELLDEVSEDTYVVCFSVHGMGNNVTDLSSMAILPEVLYRFNFPGKVALAPGKSSVAPPPTITRPIRNSWVGEIWVKNYEPNPLWRALKVWIPKQFLPQNVNGLLSPWSLNKLSIKPDWLPGMWYSPLWPQMKAFALPGFVDGQIRINLQGRDSQGIVPYSEYNGLCETLIDILYDLKDARTNERLVEKVVRTRRYPEEDYDNPNLPDADLVAIWNTKSGIFMDVVDSSKLGRIGPLPHARPGGHRHDGFFTAKGQGIEAGSKLHDIEGVDIGPTILEMLGAPIPVHLDGSPQLSPSFSSPV